MVLELKMMRAWLLKLSRANAVERDRSLDQKCGNCRHFVDCTDPEEGDYLGKCAWLIDTLGFQEALKIDEYGGPWAHVDEWCKHWEEGPSLWQPEEQPASDAVDPHVADTGTPTTRE